MKRHTKAQKAAKSKLVKAMAEKTAKLKVALVVRIRGINRLSPKVRKILQLLRLRQIHNAVFLRLNGATMQMLKLVEPYIAYGYPTRDTIERLVKKRGFAKVNKQRMPINDHNIVENNLPEGVSTLDDIYNSIWTVDENFTAVNNFLWPFKLSSPRGGYRGQKRNHFNEGGSFGNHEQFINEFISKMY